MSETEKFSCPRWHEIPDDGLLSNEATKYISDVLCPIFQSNQICTKTMVQNYIKWGILPPIKGKKYYRLHLSYLIVISIYKQVLQIKQLKKGINLQLKRMDYESAYNEFAIALENSIEEILFLLKNQNILKNISDDTFSVNMVAKFFANKLLVEKILELEGYEKLRREVCKK